MLIFLVLAKRLSGKSISVMTYLVSSGPLNLNSVHLQKHLLGDVGTCSTIYFPTFWVFFINASAKTIKTS